MSRVRFWTFLNGRVVPGPLTEKDLPLAMLLHDLLNLSSPEISGVDPMTCKFYKFTEPLHFSGRAKEVENACLANRHKQEMLEFDDCVEDLAEDKYLSHCYVCLVIETPQLPHLDAINKLSYSHNALFQALQIHVENIKSWSMIDVENNMSGGVFWDNGKQPNEGAIRDFDDALSGCREYNDKFHDPSDDFAADLEMVREQMPEAFDEYFKVGSSTVKDSGELLAVYALGRSHPCFKRISSDPSSRFKSNELSYLFFKPPFFLCQTEDSRTVFKIDLPWGFPIFVTTEAEGSNWCRFNPSSEYSVIVKDFLCPFLLCEVVSDHQETDRYHMLLQGIAAIRIVNILKKRDSKKNLFVVAVYLKANLTAERYIIMQTSTGKVHIAQRDYDLLDPGQALKFLRAMFNLQDQIENFAKELDDSHIGKSALSRIAKIASPIISLASRTRRSMTRTKGTATMDSISGDAGRPSQRCGGQYRFTDDPEVRKHLDGMDYRVDAFLFGFPNVAMISCKSNCLERGILKFTKRQSEVEILQHLTKFPCEQNHTIPGIQVWTLPSRGFVVFSHSGGSHLTDLHNPDVHMWSAARQLVEGVAFMHNRGVAHLDIKPANVLIHPNGGRLSIIDYSVSEFVKPGTKLHVVKGTENYIAPEVNVKHPEYDPIRADLWSSGKMLRELLACCHQYTRERTFLVGIIDQLMADDPLARPMMLEVLQQMSTFDPSIVKYS